MFACPVASVVLNFSEMLGQGQKTAANLVLLGTGLSAITIPLMVLIL
jgi:predicted permease